MKKYIMFILILVIINIQIFGYVHKQVTKNALERLLIVEPYKIVSSEYVVMIADKNGLSEDMFTAEIEIIPGSYGFYNARYNGKFITLMKNYGVKEKETIIKFDRSKW